MESLMRKIKRWSEKKRGIFVEWRIENFSHWSAEVHGECIKSPRVRPTMELYPKGISGTEEHLVVRFCGNRLHFSGDLSFYSSDGTLLCPEQAMNAGGDENVLQPPPGPKFEDVLARIHRESEDFITVRCRIEEWGYYEQRMCTTVNGLKISLKISPSWIEEVESDDARDVCFIQLFSKDTKNLSFTQISSKDNLEGITLRICSENNKISFKVVSHSCDNENPFAVYMCVSLTGSDGTVDRRVKKEHVFHDDGPWTFLDSLEKKELVGKEISLFLCLKTRTLIQGTHCVNFNWSCVSIEPNNTLCFSEKDPSTDDPITSDKDLVTNDSGSQNSVTSDMPDASVLSKDLMCLYQDQDFSDVTLRCDKVSFPVHRNILSARSPVFKTMLTTDMTEAASGSVDIGDLDPSTLGTFLTYLYTGAVEEELQCDRALKLYYAADKYQVPSLKKECADLLCSKVSLSNVYDILSVVDKHQDDQLTSVAHDFILKNFNEVLASEPWERFMKSEPLLALETLTEFAKNKKVIRGNE